jgi:DNA-binding response OmpR family regulator
MDRWRILVVDDNRDTLDLIRMTLEADYDVLTLDNAIETPDVLSIFEPDLVLLDIMMPKVSGFKIIEYMKKQPGFKDIPVIFLSAKGAASDQRYGYTLGAALYLTKPFEPSRLVKNVKLTVKELEGKRKAKKFTLREVELRLSLQTTYKTSTDQDARDEVSKKMALHKKKQEEEGKKDVWLD